MMTTMIPERTAPCSHGMTTISATTLPVPQQPQSTSSPGDDIRGSTSSGNDPAIAHVGRNRSTPVPTLVTTTTTTTDMSLEDHFHHDTDDDMRHYPTPHPQPYPDGCCSGDHSDHHCHDQIHRKRTTTTTATAAVTSGRRNIRTTFTDEQLLIVAFLSFLSFAILQMMFAIYVAHSHAMIGDSSVMFLDALTYLCNGYSERQKRHYSTQYEYQIPPPPPPPSEPLSPVQSPPSTIHEPTTDSNNRNVANHDRALDSVEITSRNSDDEADQQQQLLFLELRQKVIVLEIVAPSISVVALIIVTIVVTQQAIRTIQSLESTVSTGPEDRHVTEEPNLYVILWFSLFNLLLDGINMYFFTRPNHIRSICSQILRYICTCCGRPSRRPITSVVKMTEEEEDGMTDSDLTELPDCTDGVVLPSSTSAATTTFSPAMARGHNVLLQDVSMSHSRTKEHYNHSRSNATSNTTTTATPRPTKIVRTNMNMCSAYTHVLADTLRSIAVITAVLLALYNDIEPALADATAALIVSALIALSLIPLVQGLYHNVYELYNIRLQLQQYNPQACHCPNTTTMTTTSIESIESNHSNSTIV